MRKSPLLDAIFPKTKQAVLAATLLQPERWWYLSEIAHYLSVTPSSLQRELQRLCGAGILEQRIDGNRTYYRCNAGCPFAGELQGLLIKTVGVLGLLDQALKLYARAIEVAFVFGSFAQSSELVGSDIDLMVIGSLGLAELAPVLRKVEKRVNRPINPVILTAAEARQKLAESHHFLESVRQAKKYFLRGEQSELGKAFGSQTDQNSQDELVGA